MKACLVLGVLALSLAGSLASQVPLRPPPDTAPRPTWPGFGEQPSQHRHSHKWQGAAVGAAVGGVVGYVVWRPSDGPSDVWNWGPRISRGTAVGLGAAAGALVGWAIGASITGENRARAVEGRRRSELCSGSRGRSRPGTALGFSQGVTPPHPPD